MPQVKLPDGRIANFPDDMPREEIKAFIAQKFPEAAAPDPNAGWAPPGMLAPVQFKEGTGEMRWAVPQAITGMGDAISSVGKAITGQYGIEIDPETGRPTTMTNEMMGDAMGAASMGLTSLSPAASAGVQLGRQVLAPPARKIVQRELGRAGIPLNQVGPRLAQIGPDAMVADLAPGLQARAAAIATMPGSGQKSVVDALVSRRGASNSRITADVDQTLGPATIPSRMAAENVANRQALGPQYEELFRGPDVRAVDSSEVALTLDSLAVNERGGAQTAAQKVRGWLNITGENELDPNPYTLFRTRNAIDKALATEKDGGAVAVYSQIRKDIDDLLAPAVPGLKETDAQFAELARQGEAVQTGQMLLDTGKTAPRPSDVEDMMTGGALPQGAQIGPSAVPVRLREGARAEIDRIIGTNIRDINAMKRIVAGEGNWNRDRLVSVFGKEKAAKLLSILEREALYDATENLGLAGSRTQVLKAAQEDIVGKGPRPNPVRSAANLQFGDAAAALADRTYGWLSNNKRSSVNEQIAKALIAKGGDGAMVAAIAARPAGMKERAWLDLLRAFAQEPEHVAAGPRTLGSPVAQALLGPRR